MLGASRQKKEKTDVAWKKMFTEMKLQNVILAKKITPKDHVKTLLC